MGRDPGGGFSLGDFVGRGEAGGKGGRCAVRVEVDGGRAYADQPDEWCVLIFFQWS